MAWVHTSACMTVEDVQVSLGDCAMFAQHLNELCVYISRHITADRSLTVACRHVQVLLDFLRLLRQRKVTEMQAVRGQLAGLETDLTEASRRLERVVAAAAPARQLPLPAADRLAIAMQPVSEAVPGAQPGGAAGLPDVQSVALRSRSLPPSSARSPSSAAAPTAATAAPSRKRARDENEAEESLEAGKAERAPAASSRSAVLAASKVARIMSAFPAADVAYLARRAAAAKATGRQPLRSSAGRADAPALTAAAALQGPTSAAVLSHGQQIEPADGPAPTQPLAQQPADDHLTLFMEDIAAFTRYREIKVACLRVLITGIKPAWSYLRASEQALLHSCSFCIMLAKPHPLCLMHWVCLP